MFHEIHVGTGILSQIVLFPLVPYLLSVGERNSLVSIYKILSSNGKMISCCRFLEVVFVIPRITYRSENSSYFREYVILFIIYIKFSPKYLLTMSSTE